MLEFQDYLEIRNTSRKEEIFTNKVYAIYGAREQGKALRHMFHGKGGNLLIQGIPGSGLYNCVCTIIFDLLESFTRKEVYINICDMNAAGDFEFLTANKERFKYGVELHLVSSQNYAATTLDSLLKDLERIVDSEGRLKIPNIVFITGISKAKLGSTNNRWAKTLSRLSKLIDGCYSKNLYIVIADSNVPDTLPDSIINKFDSRLLLRSFGNTITRIIPSDDVNIIFEEKYGTGYSFEDRSTIKVDLTAVPDNVWKEW